MRLIAALCLLLPSAALAVSPDSAESLFNQGKNASRVRLHAELGALAVPKHEIRFSNAGTLIDYVDDGGQDNLFSFLRLSADLDLGDRHTVVFLYQPIDLRTKAMASRDLVVDEATFARGTPMRFRYGFGFWRGSWMYDLQPEGRREFSLGAGLQIRNATIEFESLDGTTFRSNRDIGRCPCSRPACGSRWVRAGSSAARSTASTRPSSTSTAAAPTWWGRSSMRRCGRVCRCGPASMPS